MYPVELAPEAIDLHFTATKTSPSTDTVDASSLTVLQILAGVLRFPLVSYTAQPEELNLQPLHILGGEVRLPVVFYTDPANELNLTSLQVDSGTLKVAVISYTNWTPEPIDLGQLKILSGTLT